MHQGDGQRQLGTDTADGGGCQQGRDGGADICPQGEGVELAGGEQAAASQGYHQAGGGGGGLHHDGDQGTGSNACQRTTTQRLVQQIPGTPYQHSLQYLAEPGDAAEDQQDADDDGGDGGALARQEGDRAVDKVECRGDKGLHKVHPLHRHVSGAYQQRGQPLGALLQQTKHQLQWHEDKHSQQVEEVVHGRGGKGTAKLGPVPDMTHGDYGVGDGGAEVGPHHHGDGHADGQAARHQTDDHRGDSAGGLHQGRRQYAEQQGDKGIVCEGEDLGCALGAAGEALEAVGNGANGNQNDVDQCDNRDPVEQRSEVGCSLLWQGLRLLHVAS